MTSTWDEVIDYSEEEESFEDILRVKRRAPDAITGQRVSVVDVAEAILRRFSGPVDTWKLQKLCYLVQGHHLGRTRLPAFREPIEAWTHGPVTRELYRRHPREFQVGTVHGNADAAVSDPTMGAVIETVLQRYGAMSGAQLRELTHSQSPWINARAGLPPEAPSQEHLSAEDMRQLFAILEAVPSDDAEDDFLH